MKGKSVGLMLCLVRKGQRRGIAMKLRSLCWALVGGLVLAGTMSSLQSAPPEGPEPIRIKRRGGPPVIPDRPRNQVIGFALYTVHKGVLKLSVQLYPLKKGEPRAVTLEVRDGEAWKKLGTPFLAPKPSSITSKTSPIAKPPSP